MDSLVFTVPESYILQNLGERVLDVGRHRGCNGLLHSQPGLMDRVLVSMG